MSRKPMQPGTKKDVILTTRVNGDDIEEFIDASENIGVDKSKMLRYCMALVVDGTINPTKAEVLEKLSSTKE